MAQNTVRNLVIFLSSASLSIRSLYGLVTPVKAKSYGSFVSS